MQTGTRSRGPYVRGERTRARALQAAEELIADPQAPLTLRSLAESAGLTDAGVLHHFGSRDGLLVAAAAQASAGGGDEQAEVIRELLRIACDRSSPARASALDVLHRQCNEGGHDRLVKLFDRAVRTVSTSEVRNE